MVETGIFANNAEVERKAGSKASAISKAEAYTNDYLTQVESMINTVCRVNYSDTFSSLNADTKGLLKEAATNFAAIYVIIYDMSGYTTRIEAEDMINTLRDAGLRALALLRDKKKTDFITKA